MLRTHTCGELRMDHIHQKVVLCGWVQRVRNKGGIVWVDLRDRYGITQLTFEEEQTDAATLQIAKELGREYVLKATGMVVERYSKNDKIPTGSIEVKPTSLQVLNTSKTPPFTIEENTDGGEDLRMKYRYLDLRRNTAREKLQLRHKIVQQVRTFLADQQFIEVETPVLIKSTPEGARDFVVPSRSNSGEFYALPQSPQTFKQLLMVSGFDRYFQIVKCFRDEDLRSDRQPEFTQIDCEMSFVSAEDIYNTFEKLMQHLFKTILGMTSCEVTRMTYADAMKFYGSDKPDTRFEMKFIELNDIVQNRGFNVFDHSQLVVAICAKGCGKYTRKQIDKLTDFVKRPQVGAKGLVYVKCNEDGTFKSSVDKFYNHQDLKVWASKCGAEAGDLILVLSGDTDHTRHALSELRLHLGSELGLRNANIFSPLWIIDFPLLKWDEDSQSYHAMHHPFTSPKAEDLHKLNTTPEEVCANAYDLVINGVEIGGGSIRIHDKNTQALMFKHLGFAPEEVQKQFGFLMEAFEYGAPPHGGIAFGLDRLCSLFGGSSSIRDYIAFPKNNSGRDVMIDSPAKLSDEQLKELHLKLQ